VWISSPRAEFRSRDRGGRTAHERAFTRAAYYQVQKVPHNLGQVPDWSLKLTWGSDGDRRLSRPGHLARPVMVRVFPRSAARVRRGSSWTDDPARQSKIGADGGRVIGF
jgi:hypothetical protein